MAVVFHRVTVADGVTAPRADVDVVMTDGQIADIRPSKATGVTGSVVAAGGYLVPGLVDSHVHFSGDDHVNEVVALLHVMHGVTNVQCMNGSPAVLDLRARIAAGETIGPRVWTTGPAQNDPELDRATGRARALEQARAGYDAIKVYNDLTRDGFKGLVEGAAAGGIPVVGHVVRDVGLAGTLASPQQHIAHLEELIYTGLGFDLNRLMQPDPVTIDVTVVNDLARDLVAAGPTVCTSIEALMTAGAQVRDAATWCARRDVRQLPMVLRSAWAPPNNEYANRFTDPRHVRAFGRLAALAGQLAYQLHARRVPIVAGTDALLCGVAPGISLHRELRYLTEVGLTPADAVRTALPLPLSLPGDPPRQLEVGAPADIVLLDGNPFDSLTRFDHIRGVVIGGKWLDATRLRDRLNQLSSVDRGIVRIQSEAATW